MKTIKQWLNTLPSPYREQALTNTNKDVLKENPSIPDLECALLSSFVWSKSPEGKLYWSNLVRELRKQNTKTKIK